MLSVIRILWSLLDLYVLILLIRVVLDWVQLFARSWRPTGAVLVVANVVYGLTDPPLRQIRRFMPLLRLGGLGIDLSFLVLWLGIFVVQRLLLLLV
ncbi:YggT family protein [Actinomyces qiguomingii]|uniref:YggT family protein n=1 Tax=Actinomyces qiguomingii TaxID=2057800 RepID=UPI000CA01ABB|nr:YggT family protein [Actinomyces qiguomingii]